MLGSHENVSIPMALSRGNNFLKTQTLPNPRLPHGRHIGLTAMLFCVGVSGDSIHTVSTLGPAEPTQPYVALLRESAGISSTVSLLLALHL